MSTPAASDPRYAGLGGGAFAAEAFFFPACFLLASFVFDPPHDIGRAVGVTLALLLVVGIGATLAITDRPRGEGDHEAVRRFARRLAVIGAVAVTASAFASLL